MSHFSIKADPGSQWRCTLCTSLANHQKVKNLIQKIWQFLDFSLRFVVPIYLDLLQMELKVSEEDNAMLLPITDLLKKITNWDDETEFEEEFPNVSSLFWKPVKSLTPKVIWTHCSSESHILVFCSFPWLFPQLAGLVKDAINGRYESYSKVNNDKSYPDLVAFVLIILNLCRLEEKINLMITNWLKL